ncbi:hypothetical protein BSKO_08962 [Bryopsis sp. KO-2023]|nr:hypothetical protein BSKO_08962 [Bryopsis sp. KO-2023]
MGSSQNAITIEHAFETSIGELGWGQLKATLLGDYPWLTTAMQVFLMSLAEFDPVAEGMWSCVDPNDGECLAVQNLKDIRDRKNQFCELDESQWQWDRRDSSIVSDFGLQCEDGKVEVVKSAFFVGWLVGAGFLGYVADRLGRRDVLFCAMAISAISTLLGSLAPSYWFYLASRIFSGIGNGGQSVTCFVLVSEIIGQRFRGKHTFWCQFHFVAGECLIVGLAMLIKPWRYLTLSVELFILPFFAACWWIPRSPRWLLIRGRRDEAIEVLKKIAKDNGTKMPDAPIMAVDHKQDTNKVLRDLLKHAKLRMWFLISMATWLIVCVGYYGVTLTTNRMKGSRYAKFLWMSLAELPAYILFPLVVDVLGRKPLYVGGFVIGGVSCLAVLLVPGWLEMPMAVLGKFGLSGVFALAYGYTMEIFPTSVRNASVGASDVSSRIGGILAPQISLLAQTFSSSFPFIFFAVVNLFAALISLGLPETMGKPLPDSIEDVDKANAVDTNARKEKKSWFRKSQPYDRVPDEGVTAPLNA